MLCGLAAPSVDRMAKKKKAVVPPSTKPKSTEGVPEGMSKKAAAAAKKAE